MVEVKGKRVGRIPIMPFPTPLMTPPETKTYFMLEGWIGKWMWKIVKDFQ
jgi:hypothetical protein